jgi:hypothetical protein
VADIIICIVVAAGVGAFFFKNNAGRALFLSALDTAAVIILAIKGCPQGPVFIFAAVCAVINVMVYFLPSFPAINFGRADIAVIAVNAALAAAGAFFAAAKGFAHAIQPAAMSAETLLFMFAAMAAAGYFIISRPGGGK